jgi:hypothetical protein
MSTAPILRTQKGIFGGITNADYHRSPELSSTGLQYLAQSPAHYLEYRRNPPSPTAAMNLGTAIHAAVLESGLDAGLIVRAPGSTRATNLYKDFAKENAGKLLLLTDEYDRVTEVANAIQKHPIARTLLTKGKAEQSAYWQDPETGIWCKCRPDFLREDGVVIDLKSTSDASLPAFQRAITDRKYHWQSAWYLDGLSQILGMKLDQFVHLVVETEAPYGIAIYVLDDASLDRAREDIRRILGQYAECLHTGEWPSYPVDVQSISLRHWEF